LPLDGKLLIGCRAMLKNEMLGGAAAGQSV